MTILWEYDWFLIASFLLPFCVYLLFFSFLLVVDFFNRINLIYGTVSEFCTESVCPVMSGGPK